MRLAVQAEAARPTCGPRSSMDLLVVTAAIHFVGSMQTYVAFVYLFHIVLACIFFPARQSFMVTLLATPCTRHASPRQPSGLAPPRSIFDRTARRIRPRRRWRWLTSSRPSSIWLVVWDLGLAPVGGWSASATRNWPPATASLVAAQNERLRHMLTTTHQFKAPFAAIHANVQLLLSGTCGPLCDEALGSPGEWPPAAAAWPRKSRRCCNWPTWIPPANPPRRCANWTWRRSCAGHPSGRADGPATGHRHHRAGPGLGRWGRGPPPHVVHQHPGQCGNRFRTPAGGWSSRRGRRTAATLGRNLPAGRPARIRPWSAGRR